MIRITTLSMLLAISASATAQQASIEHSFSTPPDSIKPSVYWYWMNNLSIGWCDKARSQSCCT